MHVLLTEYLTRLRTIQSRQDLIALYYWLWDRATQLENAVDVLNSSLDLTGDRRFTHDLPTVGIGGFRGLVVLGVNPGWRADLNAREDAFCRLSKENYVDLMLGFFKTHPEVVGIHIHWWAHALSYAPLVDEWRDTYRNLEGLDRWRAAHTSQLVGGWDLIPFHSESDGVTTSLSTDNWVRTCALESIRALERLHPESVLVASKAGTRLARTLLYPALPWSDATLGTGRLRAALSRAVTPGGVEIITLSRQLSAPRNFTDAELIAGVRALRGRRSA